MGDIGRAMYRISGWKNREPLERHNSTAHPSVSNDSGFSNYQAQIGLTQTFGGNMVHELKVYFHYLTSFRLAVGDVGPRVLLSGLTLGHPGYLPLNLIGRTWTVRDDVTLLLGDHEVKLGGDYIWNNDFYEWNNSRFGELTRGRGTFRPASSSPWGSPIPWPRCSRSGTTCPVGICTRSARSPSGGRRASATGRGTTSCRTWRAGCRTTGRSTPA